MAKNTCNFLLAMLLFVAVAQPAFGQVPQLHETPKDSNIILPPAWAFGVLYGGYTNQVQTIQRVKEIKKHGYPIDAYWIDSWFWSFNNKGEGPAKYLDFKGDNEAYPSRKKMWRKLQQDGVKGGFWIWDCILKTGNEEAFEIFLKSGYFSSVTNNKNSWHNAGTSTAMFQADASHPGTPTGNIDFQNPAAVNYFKQRVKPFFDEGADFIKLDRTSAIPTCKAMFEMSQEFGKETKGRGFLLSHTGGMENETYKRYPAKWTDDTRSDWTVDSPRIKFDSWVPKVALKENIEMYTDTAKKSSRIPFLTNDLGGFDMGKTKMPEEELYIRWLQFSLMLPITEVFSQPENPTANLAWKYSEKADQLFKEYARQKMEMFPFFYSYAHLQRLLGKPTLQTLSPHKHQYMLGNEILVAPVHIKNARTVEMFFPAGEWIDFYSGERVQGNRSLTVSAPLEQIPMYIKAGSIIPMRPYAGSIEKGSNKKLLLHIFPGKDNAHFSLIEDDGTSNDYLAGGYAHTKIEMKNFRAGYQILIHPVSGQYKGMKMKRTWTILFHSLQAPSSVFYKGKSLAWVYNAATNVIIIPTRKLSVKSMQQIEINF